MDIVYRSIRFNEPDLLFLQLAPENFLVRQRFLSHKEALAKTEDFELHAIPEFNPTVPLSWEELVVNLSVLDMLRHNETFGNLKLPESFYTYNDKGV